MEVRPVDERIILDLCGGTGAWSRPYKEAGYDVRVVTHPFNDVLTWTPSAEERERAYGVLAAPPCTMFSFARTTAKTPRDLRTAMETVFACLRIIAECQYEGSHLKFWAMENPKARLRWFLGKPVMTFSPEQFGDPHRKPTDLWGNFNTNLRKSPVDITELEPYLKLNIRRLPRIPTDYVRPDDMRREAIARSITPAGFASAFFNANR